MDLVVDANIVIAAIVSSSGHTADLFFSDRLSIYAPEFLLDEIRKYESAMVLKSGLSNGEIEKLISILLSRIKLFPRSELAEQISIAEKFSPDQKDTVYLALALKLNCAVWSNDKLLKKQSKVGVISTSELLQIFS